MSNWNSGSNNPYGMSPSGQSPTVYARLSVQAGVQAGTTIEMTTTSLTFGRKAEGGVDYAFQGASYVSGKHCTIRYENQVFILVDHGSSNGTYVDGEEAKPNQPIALRDGATIQLGRTPANSVILRFMRVIQVAQTPSPNSMSATLADPLGGSTLPPTERAARTSLREENQTPPARPAASSAPIDGFEGATMAGQVAFPNPPAPQRDYLPPAYNPPAQSGGYDPARDGYEPTMMAGTPQPPPYPAPPTPVSPINYNPALDGYQPTNVQDPYAASYPQNPPAYQDPYGISFPSAPPAPYAANFPPPAYTPPYSGGAPLNDNAMGYWNEAAPYASDPYAAPMSDYYSSNYQPTGLVYRAGFRYGVGGCLVVIAILMMISFFLFPWMEFEADTGLGTEGFSATAIQIWLGSSEENFSPTAEGTGFSHVRLVDRFLIVIPLGAITLLMLAVWFLQGYFARPVIGLGVIVILLFLLLAFPFVWQILSTATFRSELEEIMGDGGLITIDQGVELFSSTYSFEEHLILSGLGFGISLIGFIVALISSRRQQNQPMSYDQMGYGDGGWQ